MSDQLNQTVQVTISRETTAVARAAFNVPAFVSSHTAFMTRTKVYNSASAVLADFPSTSSAYIAAVEYFGQERKPPRIIIGRRQVNSVNVTVNGAVVVGATYSMTVDGVVVSYVAQVSDTAQLIIDGLEAAFGAISHPNTSFVDNTSSFTIAPVASGANWSFKTTSNLTVTNASPTETWANALTAAKFASNAWYGLNTEDHTDASILAIAAWAEANNVLYGASSSSAALLTSATNDIGSQLRALSYSRTFLMYSALADTQFPEAAWMGDRLPPVAGSAQWIHAQLVGVTPDNLTDDQVEYLNTKRVNYYIVIAEVPVTKKGWVSAGTFIEETILIDWTKSRIQERIFFRMVNSLKLPSDNAGLAVIQTDIFSVLYEGVRNGGFASSPAPSVYVPDILDIDPNLRAQGIVTGIKFRARMVISITEVIIEGTVVI